MRPRCAAYHKQAAPAGSSANSMKSGAEQLVAVADDVAGESQDFAEAAAHAISLKIATISRATNCQP